MTVTAILMLGAEGPEPAAQWVAGGRTAAAADALALLQSAPDIDRLIFATPNRTLAEQHPEWNVQWDFDAPGQPFHFGHRLSGLLAAYPAPVHLYLGAGSAPLLTTNDLTRALSEVRHARAPRAIANNRLSPDWMVFNCAAAVQARPARLERDNMLGYVLQTEAGIEVRGLPARAATRLDIDTPADLLLLSLHPACADNLSAYLRAHPQNAARWQAAGRALYTPGGRVALMGRVSASVWSHVEGHTRAWVRVFSEERGMAASGRQSAGQVRSLLADYLLRLGPRAFFDSLSEMVDAAFFDTRVLLAHQRRWPSAADRYASDLGQPEHIRDDFLRALTQAANAAPIPIVLGGHGVVAGDVYGLVEVMEGEGPLREA